MTALGAWDAIVKKAFVENKGILHGNPNIILKHTTGVPGAHAGPVGTLIWNDSTKGYDRLWLAAENFH